MSFGFKRIKTELTKKNIPFTQEQDSILANGYRIQYSNGEYSIHGITTGDKINTEPIIFINELMYAIGAAIDGTPKQQLEFVFSERKKFIERKKRFLEKNKKRIGPAYQKIVQLMNDAHANQKPTKRIIKHISRLITTNREKSDKTYHLQDKVFLSTFSNIIIDKDYVLPIPLDPVHVMENKISVYDFVIIEFLVSFPRLMSEFTRIAEGEGLKIYPYLLEHTMFNRESVPVMAIHWKDIILTSPFKVRIYKLCLYLLSRGDNFEYLTTHNKHIWTQIAMIYAIRDIDISYLNPKFVEKLRGFSLTVQ